MKAWAKCSDAHDRTAAHQFAVALVDGVGTDRSGDALRLRPIGDGQGKRRLMTVEEYRFGPHLGKGDIRRRQAAGDVLAIVHG